jgi:hypothetical protein
MDGITAQPDGDNLYKWSASIQGPAGTPYEGYAFDVSMEIPTEYPFKPPKVRHRGDAFPTMGATCCMYDSTKSAAYHPPARLPGGGGRRIRCKGGHPPPYAKRPTGRMWCPQHIRTPLNSPHSIHRDRAGPCAHAQGLVHRHTHLRRPLRAPRAMEGPPPSLSVRPRMARPPPYRCFSTRPCTT